jgi:predicted ATP-dependent protease
LELLSPDKIDQLDEETRREIEQRQAVGQVNGISVLPQGDHSVGSPSRITARAYVGSASVVNIDR